MHLRVTFEDKSTSHLQFHSSWDKYTVVWKVFTVFIEDDPITSPLFTYNRGELVKIVLVEKVVNGHWVTVC